MYLVKQHSEFRKEERAKVTFSNAKKLQPSLCSQGIEMDRYNKRDEEPRQSKWLNNLNERPLLELMTEELQHSQFTPINATELNCYERLKKLLTAQNGTNFQQRQAENQEKVLDNVIVMENHINQLQEKFKGIDSLKRKTPSNKSIKSYIVSKNNSVSDKFSVSTSLNTSQKDLLKENNHLRRQTKHESSQKTIAFAMKKSLKDQIISLKESCCEKFVRHKKDLNNRVYEDIEEHIRSRLQSRMEQIVNCKIGEYHSIKQENSKFNTILFEKQLEIQSLKKELRMKQEKISSNQQQLEPYAQMVTFKQNIQQFYEDYHSIFGNLSLKDLKKKLDIMQNMYINKYAHSESKHLETVGRLKQQKDDLEAAFIKKLKIHQKRQNELNEIIICRQMHEKLDNSEEKHEIFNRIPEYKLKCTELQQLQRYILNKYIEWLNTKGQVQTKIINMYNNNHQLEKYEEMIETMLQFDKNFGSPQKNIEYTAKLLGNLQKIKKVMNPNRAHQKLEPFKTMDQIEVYIKNAKQSRHPKKIRTINKGGKDNTGDYFNEFNN